MMKRLLNILLGIVVLFSIYSCAKEEDFPVTADFSINIVNNDYSVPVKVEIKNTTKGADQYEWTFEGANIEQSKDKNPPIVTYIEAGKYTIKLKASNKDGNSDEKSIDIVVDAAVNIDFDWEMIGSDVSPVTLQMHEKTDGATSYLWDFENGIPAVSTEQNPKVIFTKPGTHKIKLTISNGKETYSATKDVTVKEGMHADFDWSVDFIDNDMEAPVKLYLNNKSSAAVSYQWLFSGANITQSTEENPNVIFQNSGVFDITLKATNDKETKTVTKQITIKPNKNLLSFSDVRLGINTAHATLGSFFSSQLGKVIKKNEVNSENGKLIDIAYFGLDSSFTSNQFLSPDKVQTTAFTSIPNAISEHVINSQERIGVQLSSYQFDLIDNGSDFNSINITDSSQGRSSFSSQLVPRVVLIKTEDGRKGAIKIKSFIVNGKESYIVVDIKIQKTN